MKKSFKLSQRPGQPSAVNTTGSLPASAAAEEEITPTAGLEPNVRRNRPRGTRALRDLHSIRAAEEPPYRPSHNSPTTRKTIEVPEDYFFRVKMHALQRRIKEKDMWEEILEEYFTRHSDLR